MKLMIGAFSFNPEVQQWHNQRMTTFVFPKPPVPPLLNNLSWSNSGYLDKGLF
nr:hypothetical protein [uncultured Acinetobacter sp.]